jgi:hypothetical protein
VRSIEEIEREIGTKVKREVGAETRNPTEAGCDKVTEGRSNNEDSGLSKAGSNDSMNADVSGDESSHTYCFGASTITLDWIHKMAEKGYFVEGEACVAREETTLEPQDYEVVVFEDFFIAGLQMPPHPALADILLKFQVQLHQLMPTVVA